MGKKISKGSKRKIKDTITKIGVPKKDRQGLEKRILEILTAANPKVAIKDMGGEKISYERGDVDKITYRIGKGEYTLQYKTYPGKREFVGLKYEKYKKIRELPEEEFKEYE